MIMQRGMSGVDTYRSDTDGSLTSLGLTVKIQESIPMMRADLY